MEIIPARKRDVKLLLAHDKWIAERELLVSIQRGMVFLLEEEREFAGWMRYGLFWDHIPFLNMIHLLEPYRRRGFGSDALLFWEAEMFKQGFETVMTSTSSEEEAQQFYRKKGYRVVGGFMPPDGGPYELLLCKEL